MTAVWHIVIDKPADTPEGGMCSSQISVLGLQIRQLAGEGVALVRGVSALLAGFLQLLSHALALACKRRSARDVLMEVRGLV